LKKYQERRMTKHLKSFLQGLLVAGVYAIWYERSRRVAPSARSRGPARTAPGIDLNEATIEQLLLLPGLDRELAERIIENRPYRNKLDLLSRLVVPEETYVAIKHLVYVPPEAANEPVKVAG